MVNPNILKSVFVKPELRLETASKLLITFLFLIFATINSMIMSMMNSGNTNFRAPAKVSIFQSFS